MNDRPPSVDFTIAIAALALFVLYVRYVRYTAPSGPTARSANCSDAPPSEIRCGLEYVSPRSVERENMITSLPAFPLKRAQAT